MAIDTKALAPYQQFDNRQLDIIKKTVAKGLTNDQFLLFVEVCKHYRLNPMARQIYAYPDRNGRMIVQTGIDGFRLMAEETGLYGGQIGPEWCGLDGVWKDVWLEKEPPAAARVGIIRRDFDKPIWGVARYSSYAGTTPVWAKMPDVMLSKCAESLAFRKAFPAKMSGIYTHEEMDQAANDVHMSSYAIQEINDEEGLVTSAQLATIRKLCEKLNRPMRLNEDKQTAEEAIKRIQELQEEVDAIPEMINKGQIITIQKLREKLGQGPLPGVEELTFEDAKAIITQLNADIRARPSAQPVQQPATPKQEQVVEAAKQEMTPEQAIKVKRLAVYERAKDARQFEITDNAVKNTQSFLKFVSTIINATVAHTDQLTASRLDAIEAYLNSKDAA